MRVIIVDDEPLARDCIRLTLQRRADIEIVGEFGDGSAAVQGIGTLDPDLVFLDIQMSGMSGFDVIEAVGVDRMPPVIFVTAHDRFALRAFEVHAFDYLLKPFEDDRLLAAVDRAIDVIESPANRAQLSEQLMDLLAHVASGREQGITGESSRRYATRLAVRHDGRVRYLAVSQVDWFEASGNYVRIHVGNEVHRLRSTLVSLCTQLDPARFARIHRSRIVNLERVREVQPWVGGDYVALLKDGQQLRVSRVYRDAVLAPIR